MASTKTPGSAVNIIRKLQGFSQFAGDDSFAHFAANEAIKLMWRDYEWRSSIGALTPFYPIAGYPDTTTNQAAVPVDFDFLLDAWLRSYDGGEQRLDIMRELRPAPFEGPPSSISYRPETGVFRLHPTPAGGWGAPHWQVEGRYKKRPTLYTGDTFNSTALPFDDNYFDVYLAALKYVYYRTVGSPLAGGVAYSAGQAQFSGALAEYKAALDEVKRLENQHAGQLVVVPAEGLFR